MDAGFPKRRSVLGSTVGAWFFRTGRAANDNAIRDKRVDVEELAAVMRERLDQAYVDVVDLVFCVTGKELGVQAKVALRSRLEWHIAMTQAAVLRAVLK